MTPTSGQGGASGKGVAGSPATSAPKTGDAAQATKDRQAAAAKVVSTAKVDPIQQAAALRAEGVQPGFGTAAAQAAAGSPGGEETAGDQPPEAGSREVQAAVITPSGSLQAGYVGSPSGPVPVGAFTDHAAAQKASDQALLDAHSHAQRGLSGHRRLDQATLSRMSRAEIRAVAADRGYDEILGGRRAQVAGFLKAQEDDDLIMEDSEVAAQLRANTPVPQAGVGPAAATGGGAVGVGAGRSAETEKAVQEVLDSGKAPEPVKIEEEEGG